MTSLVYVATKLNKKLVEAMPKSEARTKALQYHERLEANRKNFLKGVSDQLEPEVTKEGLCEFLDQFYRSYDLRMTIAGDREMEQAAQ